MSINFFVDTQELESCIVSLFYCYFSAWYHTELSSSYIVHNFQTTESGRMVEHWDTGKKKKKDV